MEKRNFIENPALGGGFFLAPPRFANSFSKDTDRKIIKITSSDTISADLIIAGGGLGGCAAYRCQF